MRIFYFSCDFLYTAVRSWVTFQLLGELFPLKRDEKVAKWIEVIVTIAVAGLNTYNNTLVKSLFSNNMQMTLIAIVAFAIIVSKKCKYSDAFCIGGLIWTSLALGDFFIQSIAYKVFYELGKQRNILLSVSAYRGIYLLILTIIIVYIGYQLRT